MEVLVTGADGFLGSRLADALLGERGELRVARLVLADARLPRPRDDPRAQCVRADLTEARAARALLTPHTAIVFHLAAAVSGHAEADFEVGLAANLDATRNLLEAARHVAPGARFVFASTVGVFGGPLPPRVHEGVAPTPQSTYGAAKAMCELLVAEYSRRGFVEGRSVRLPTVTVRAGSANAAVTSFASGVIREPLAGREAEVPVPPDTALWVSGPATVVGNLLRAARAPAWPGVALCLPGLRVSVAEMVAALRRAAGDGAAALVRYRPDDKIAALVRSFPSQFDTSLADSLGFIQDKSFDAIVQDYIKNDMKR